MKKQLFTICCALTTGAFSFSQDVNYKILGDNPNKLPIQLSVDPFYTEMSEGSARLGWGLRANAVFKKVASFNIDIRKAYLDAKSIQHSDGTLMGPLHETNNNGLKKQFVFEMGGCYSLIDRSKNKNLKVVLSSTTSTNGDKQVTKTKYIMVPGTLRNINGVRGGLNQTNLAIAFEDAKAGSFTATNKANETDFTVFGEFGPTYHGSSIYNGYTMFNTTCLYAGLSHKRITNLILDTDYGNGSKKGNIGYYDIYFDLMYGAAMNFKDILAADETKLEVKNSDLNRIGWRFGWLFNSSTKSFLTYKFEFGSKPGYTGVNTGLLSTRSYLLLTVGWSIPIKVNYLNEDTGS